MSMDSELQKRVLAELEWEPTVDAAHIGVAARGGVVTLSGQVKTYLEKMAAERATRRVKGVVAIAEEIAVELPVSDQRTDEDIAASIVNVLRWHAAIPFERVAVKVEHGHVTLTGEVDWKYQRDLAVQDVQRIRGVRMVTAQLTIKPRVKPEEVKQKIEAALRRNAELEASHILVSAAGSSVTLAGHVKTWSERQAAEAAAWSAPGVTEVLDHISLTV
ncbi:MAG: hypothetical protein B7Z80_10030 [Rhodospirillales bacterium 20-64-7]|nr:MAG: hypothetical protein B7Z80_10030 [Rhodospirillales bacterium 20-64-7]